ncbi:MAG: ABC transporter substrate-binding protein, partial [Alphaproteobacteria bacterium]|nr:ABC transporter substrate-binding protein [Alphaproteobacteria bacterium]
LLFAGPAFAKCKGTTDIAELNWESAQVSAEVLKFIIEAGYGCDVNLVAAATIPSITSMVEKGTPHISPEIWINSLKEQVEGGLASGHFIDLGDMYSDGGVEAFWIPAYMAKTHPNINTAKDLYDNAQVFQDPEDPGKGRFYTCPPGWACRIISGNIARAHNLDEKFNIFDPGSPEGLKASIAKAYARKEPWVGYYWSPTAILGKYPMKRIDLGKYDEEGHACNQTEDCANPYPGPYPVARILKVMISDYAKDNPDIVKFIKKARIPNETVNEVLAWKEDNRATGNEAAGYFMATYPKIWRKWVPSKVAKKIQKAL